MATNTIDFSAGLDLAAVEREAVLGTDKSTWVKVLTGLHEAVKAGEGKYDTFYPVGTFKNPSGAQTAIRNIVQNVADRLPVGFDLRPVVKPDPKNIGGRISVMYAAVPAPDEDEDDVEEDEVEDGDVPDTGEDEVIEEASAPKPRAKRQR